MSSGDYMDAEGVANLIRRVILELPVPGKKDGVWGLSKSTKLVPKELALFLVWAFAEAFLAVACGGHRDRGEEERLPWQVGSGSARVQNFASVCMSMFWPVLL